MANKRQWPKGRREWPKWHHRPGQSVPHLNNCTQTRLKRRLKRESTAKSCDYKTRFPLKETPRPQTRLKTRFRFSSPVEARRGAQMKTKSKRNRKSSRTELNAKHATRKIEREGERRRTSKRERERGRPREADVSQSKFLASLRMLSFLASSSFSRNFGSRTCGAVFWLTWCREKSQQKRSIPKIYQQQVQLQQVPNK